MVVRYSVDVALDWLFVIQLVLGILFIYLFIKSFLHWYVLKVKGKDFLDSEIRKIRKRGEKENEALLEGRPISKNNLKAPPKTQESSKKKNGNIELETY